MNTFPIATIEDARLTNLERLGGGEGFATYTGEFEGKPALVVDASTLADFLDQDDPADLVRIEVFDDVAARDARLEQLRLEDPGKLGLSIRGR